MSRRLHRGDVFSGAVLGALGIYVITEAQGWTSYAADVSGPALFPTIQGVALVGLSLLMIVRTVRQPPGTQEEKEKPDRAGTIRALGTWAAFAGSIALMETLGFVLAFALLTFFMVVVIFGRPVVVGAVTAVGCALAFYVVFPVLLGLTLPAGPLGF
jgi:putative tricarboxylic transport membrane protein